MKHRIALVALALTLPLGERAEASTANAIACAETDTYTFSPPLTMASQVGTASLNVHVDCVASENNTSPLDLRQRQVSFGASGSYTYIGSCGLVVMSGASAHLMVGTALVVAVGTGPYARTVPVVPNQPCTSPGGTSSVSGTGAAAWTDLAP